ncbi:hypothetical protein ANACOL_03254 [Anaerotruncus colihominis DSM 17241]|uniref:Periplasmic binding protein domain-containing protein n=2 Tax=Anaerotruncus colihominis TaxID=169435 RepID=B0PEM6_9FIRM|nr:hypothetical protein ANACOL_03254 [Anaerotruncus colihominis DSM 17241]
MKKLGEKGMKKLLALFLAVTCILTLAACQGEQSSAPSQNAAPADDAAATDEEEELTFEMVNCAFAIQFCQVEREGAEAAAEELGGVNIVYSAPQDSSGIQAQIDMINAAIAKQPDALLVAALDPDAIATSLETAKAQGVPVIAYDVAMPNAPEGTVTATVSTNNSKAAGLAAQKMFEDQAFVEKIKAATPENPVIVSVISPDAVQTAHKSRVEGFSSEFLALAEEIAPGAVEISGHVAFEKKAENAPSVIIQVDISPSASDSDIRNLAQSVISNENLIGIFCVNEGIVTGILSATTDGTDLDRETGKYKDLLIAGFDAGKTLKNAVRNQWFYGAVAQNPYDIGYQAVVSAVKASKGEAVEDIDAQAKWYNSENMDDEEIARLLYD